MELIRTKRVNLRVVDGESDHRFLFQTLTHPDCAFAFKWRGTTPTIDEFVSQFMHGVLICVVASGRESGKPFGVVFISSADLRDGHGFFAAAAHPSAQGTGLIMEALIGVLAYTFHHWPFHKLYADVDDLSLPGFRSSLGRYLAEEGRFRQHKANGDQRLDVYRLALYRSTWEQAGPRFVRALRVQHRELPTERGEGTPA